MLMKSEEPEGFAAHSGEKFCDEAIVWDRSLLIGG